ncbi:MAG: hypothetical protein HYV67_03740 [Candidatus Taylorbacteria bacterium]|nr:hypothetical protein [Candidatus Taylorbacteria bacterium]
MTNYIDYVFKLKDTLQQLPQAALLPFSDDEPIMVIRDVGLTHELIMHDVGVLCEAIRQVITKEIVVENFEETLREKFSDDGQEKLAGVVADINEKIFVKLLPALGMKALPIVPKPAVVPAAAESATPTPPPHEPVVFKGFIGQPRQIYQQPVKTATEPPRPKPPIVEVSHERMSEKPLDSFLKMLSDKLSERELQNRFDKLPYTLKTALRSVDSAKKVVDIGRKYALHVDQLGELGAETGLVILGISHPAQFLPRLTRKLALSEEKARPIAQEINTEIFLKIREALKQINEEPVQPLQGLRPAAPAQTTGAWRPSPPPEHQGSTLMKPRPSLSSPRLSNLRTSNFQTSEASEAEESLNREAILKGIENPVPTPSSQNSSGSPASTSPTRLTTNNSELKTAPVPPNLPGETEAPPFTAQTAPQPQKPPEAKPESPVPPSSDSSQLSKLADLRTSPTTSDANIVDQKLSAVVAAPKSESQYAMDPYREPLG